MNSTISTGEPWMWAVFIAFVLVMLALDLFVFGGNKAHKVSVKEAGTWTLAWVSLALTLCALLPPNTNRSSASITSTKTIKTPHIQGSPIEIALFIIAL